MSAISQRIFPELKTDRLVLRQPKPDDLDMIFFMRSDPEVNRYILRQRAKTMADAEAFLDKITRLFFESKNVNWVITLKNEEKMLGSVCLWNFSDDGTAAELGYDLAPMFQKQGIMSEAVDAVIEFGFRSLLLKSIEAFTNRQNAPSIKMLLKKGFILDKERKDPDDPDNQIYVLENGSALNGR